MMIDESNFTPSAKTGTRDHRKISKLPEEQQIKMTLQNDDSLTCYLMEEICKPANLNQAYKRVKANKGAPGIDAMSVNEMRKYIETHKESLIQSLMSGAYRPQPVRMVAIPKPGNGVRNLGILTVIDRLVQQAILQVMSPIFEKEFSNSSFGFRPNRSQHQAILQAQQYVQAGYNIVVDFDIEKFFDRVNHDVLMSRVARRIKDKRLLKIIRAFLNAGIMQNGVCSERIDGMPQGGPLSPLLSNILLHDLDMELEKRGHRFCRFADDCNIYVKSQRAGERVMESIKQFLSEKLRLKLNEAKSAVARVVERQFLGFRLMQNGKISISQASLEKLKRTVRELTKRNRAASFPHVIGELNIKLRGWINYFKIAEAHSKFETLDSWIRRKLRCYRLKQRKQGKSIWEFLVSLGAPEINARKVASSGKGWWRLSIAPPVMQAMSNAWFSQQGLINLKQRVITVNN